MDDPHILADFHPAVRDWFMSQYANPTLPQTMGWPSIASGKNTLILAPTGSGKTLAAFLWAINHLVDQHEQQELSPGVRILYVSPLKALNNDIERNLHAPLKGIKEQARRLGLSIPDLRVAVRTGDTPQSKRESMIKHPPDILITTPESLYLMLTAKRAREVFKTVQYVIVDEIHSVCSNKRGVHLSLSLERLQRLANQEFIRIGLSATQKPLELVAAFLGGLEWHDSVGKHLLKPRPVCIIDAGSKKTTDLRVVCPVRDFSSLPDEGAWPAIHETLLRDIQTHQTTLIFVNNRRLAERIAAAINDLASQPGSSPFPSTQLHAVPIAVGDDASQTSSPEVREPEEAGILVQAYHGSMSRESRESMERALKAGELRALVATSSLELGIDIGSIDLVIQIQSPKGIARGLQRVGRSGHVVHASSKGRIISTHREDLVEATVVARAMLENDVEPVSIPETCLDVLAQQIVASVSVEDWSVDALFQLVCQSYCYRNLSRPVFDNVLAMLAGRYTDVSFRELRARISWDRIEGTLRALPGSSHLAITSGGTISDRGYYAVTLEDGKTRIGEVDEEFVYETRVGDTFILGSSVWRVSSIDRNRVLVTPAPGQPARMPFWKGEGIGRSFMLGRKVGEFRRLVAEKLDDDDCFDWLRNEYPVDDSAAWNILEYFRRQREFSGIIPDDRTLLMEGFRDEIGDPRLVLHSPFGRRINGVLGLILARRLRENTGVDAQMLFNDEGVLLRTSDAEDIPLNLLDGVTPDTAKKIILEEMVSSPLFAGQFRQNAARALLMPRVAPGKRTPLWLQRLRAGDLLEVVQRHDDFPIVLETIREVLTDILDVNKCLELLAQLHTGSVRMEHRKFEIPSPFATGILFDFIAVYMYAGDTARTVPASSPAVNKALVDEVVRWDSLAGFLRPEAIEHVERRLQHSAPGFQARSAEELMQILLRLGDLNTREIAQRCIGAAEPLIQALAVPGRIVQVRLTDEEHWIAAEDLSLYSDLSDDAKAREVIVRYIQNHGPVGRAAVAQRYGIPVSRLENLEAPWRSEHAMLHGRFTDHCDVNDVEWCYRPNIERIHRQTISLLRKEITPCTLREFSLFLQRWTKLTDFSEQLRGSLEGLIEQFQGLPLPVDVWERDVIFPRIPTYSPDHLRALTRSGIIIWRGSGSGRIKPIIRDSTCFSETKMDPGEEPSSPALKILEFLGTSGAVFFQDLRDGTRLSMDGLNHGLAELFWSGRISNDAFEEILALKRVNRQSHAPAERVEILNPRHNPHRARLVGTARRALKQVPGWSGRWFVLDRIDRSTTASLEETAAAQARQLLARYGILAREFLGREDALPWSLLAASLQKMEMRGELRRGYFVPGLAGMQYALPEAADLIRQPSLSRETKTSVVLVATADPANPFGPGLELPGEHPPRVLRASGHYLAFADGSPIMLFEGNGTKITVLGTPDESLLREALQRFLKLMTSPEPLRPFKEVTIEYWNEQRPADSSASAMLRSLHFERGRDQTMRIDAYMK